MTDYVRVKLNTVKGNIIIWASKNYKPPYYYFVELNKFGEPKEKINIIIALEKDVIWEKPARMNNKYAELEIKQD